MGLFGWLGLFLGLGYLAVAIVCGRMLAGHWAYKKLERDNKRYRNLNNELEWGDAIGGALLAAPFWPIVLLIFAVGRVSHIPTIGVEKAHELKLRQERLEKAEKDLGLL